MKNLVKTLVLFIVTFNSKAQSPIINIEDGFDEIKGAYYRDTHNLLDSFEGTYLYTNGTTSLKIILQKQIMNYDGFDYSDEIVGEFQYSENGVEIKNTFPNLLVNKTHDYTIIANVIYTMGDYQCYDCTQNEIRLGGYVSESSTGPSAKIIIKKVIVDGLIAIRIHVWYDALFREESIDSNPITPVFPQGEFHLFKQS